MSKPSRLGPGDRVPAGASGIWINTQTGDRVTVSTGDRMPPTPKPHQDYKPDRLTDPAQKPGQ